MNSFNDINIKIDNEERKNNLLIFETSGIISKHFKSINEDSVYINSLEQGERYINVFKGEESKIIRKITKVIMEISKNSKYESDIDKELIANSIKVVMRSNQQNVTISDIAEIVNMTDKGRLYIDILKTESVNMLLNTINKELLIDKINIIEWFKLYEIRYNIDKRYINNRKLITEILDSYIVKNIFVPCNGSKEFDFNEILC